MAGRLIATGLAALAFASTAAAQSTVLDEAAEGLRADPVYVHPGTDALTDAEADRLRDAIDEEGAAPVSIAILPGSVRREAGSSTQVAFELGRLVGEPGVYAVVVGNQFRAVSNDLAREQAPALATRAFQTRNQDGVAAVLLDFVQRVGDVRAGRGESGESEGGGGFPRWLLVAGGAIAALLGVRAYRRRRRRERELGEVKAVAREDLVALADDVVGLDEQVEARPDAKAAYLRGMEAYQRADDAFDRARSPEDLARVSAAIADSRYEMETAKALMSGAPAPERRPPCFFDARHGSSVQDVTWISPYGGAMTVPACEEDARRVLAGEEPETRQVSVGGVRRPLWDTPAYFQPWAFGYFGAAAGGALLASAFAPEADAATGFDDLGGGDFGGDWGGGGDFGGGGGDFGGGGDGGGGF
jgi:uncharacterized membrane protein YgcG